MENSRDQFCIHLMRKEWCAYCQGLVKVPHREPNARVYNQMGLDTFQNVIVERRLSDYSTTSAAQKLMRG